MPGTVVYSFTASFGGVDLEVVDFSTDHGRDIIAWRPSRGNGVQTSDRGRRELRTDLTVQLTGTAEEITEKRQRLLELRDDGAVRTFQHPLDGLIACRLETLSERTSAGEVQYQITLVEDTEFGRKLDELADDGEATIQDVRSAAANMDTALEELVAADPALAAAIPGSTLALETAEAWDASPPTVEQQASHLGQTRAVYSAGAQKLDRSRGLEAYKALLSLLDLVAELERFAVTVQKQSPRTTLVRVPFDMPLINLLSSFYGAKDAGRLASAVVQINSLADPLRLKAGSALRLPVLNGG